MGLQNEYLNIFSGNSYSVAKSTASSQLISQLPKNIIELILFSLTLITIIVLFERNILNENLPLITVFLFSGYKLLPALQQIYSGFVLIRSNITSIDNIDIVNSSDKSIFDIKTEPENVTSLEFDDVSFSYRDKDVLNNANYKFIKGDIIGVIGESGSGKSTLMDLMIGLLPPKKGSIKVNGRKLDTMLNCSYVPQFVHLINDSVVKNIVIDTCNIDYNLSLIHI